LTSIFHDEYKTKDYCVKIISCYEKKLPGQSLVVPGSPYASLLYVTQGLCEVRFSDYAVPVKRRQLILIDAGIPFALTWSDVAPNVLGLEFDYVNAPGCAAGTRALYESNADYRQMCDSGCDYVLLGDDDDVLYGLMKETVHMCALDDREGELLGSFNASLLLLRIAGLSGRQVGEEDVIGLHYVRQALKYINEQYMDDLTVSQIAEHVHVHPSYLHRLFKTVKGVTINNYISGVRIEKAKQLLKDTDFSVMDVSISVGINSQQYFANLFKKLTGMTPSQYKHKA